MKAIYYILIIPLFLSCSDSDDDKNGNSENMNTLEYCSQQTSEEDCESVGCVGFVTKVNITSADHTHCIRRMEINVCLSVEEACGTDNVAMWGTHELDDGTLAHISYPYPLDCVNGWENSNRQPSGDKDVCDVTTNDATDVEYENLENEWFVY